MSDERTRDVVEQLVPVAEESGLSLTHMALAFTLAHPGVTSTIIGPRTMEHLDDLLAGAEVTLDDAVLDRIDAVAAPGSDVGLLDVAYRPPSVQDARVRRRPPDERSAA